MNHTKKKWMAVITLCVTLMVGLGCRVFSGLTNAAQSTPTPTSSGGSLSTEKTLMPDPCEGLTGSLELQLLVGPSEAVGLEPFTAASIPFKVETEDGLQAVSGGGPIEYYEDIMQAEWGSFSVTFEGETAISGTCFSQANESWIDISIQMTGEQTVTVVVEGMEMTYPWSGSPTIQASFPLDDGAQAEGEGWLMVLHLDNK